MFYLRSIVERSARLPPRRSWRVGGGAVSTDEKAQAVADALRRSLSDLPVSQQDAAIEALSTVLVEADRTGDASPVSRYVRSLLMTARLHRNPAYKKALREADADLDSDMRDAVPVGEFVAQMRARHP